MKEEEILKIFRDAGAFMEGHFLLTSGLHSPVYIEKFTLLRYPHYVETLVREMIKSIKRDEIDVVVGPAVGGIVLAYEAARQLETRMAFTERENGKMTFRRDFAPCKGERVLVVEDVVTTGGSVQEVVEAVRESQAVVTKVSALVDRSSGKNALTVPFSSLLQMEVQTYSPEECPLCRERIRLQKRGSRSLG